MIIIHWSRAFNYLDINILWRTSKDYDFLWTENSFNLLYSTLMLSWKYKSIKIKPTSREDKSFLILYPNKGERIVIEYTYLDKRNITKPFSTDIELYQKWVSWNWKNVTSDINQVFQVSSQLEFKTLDFFSLVEEKMSHVTSNSKEKYQRDMKKIEEYILQNNIDMSHLDTSFIEKKKRETIIYQRSKTKVELDIDTFFDEYNIKRYIKHDSLHIYIAKYFWTWKWTYSSLVEKNWFSIKETTFNSLTKEKQFSLILEEVFVLTLERKILPRYVILRETVWHEEALRKINKVFRLKFFEMYRYYTLHLKWIPKYIKDYVKKNSRELIEQWESKIITYDVINTLPKKLYDFVYHNYENWVVIKNDY